MAGGGGLTDRAITDTNVGAGAGDGIVGGDEYDGGGGRRSAAAAAAAAVAVSPGGGCCCCAAAAVAAAAAAAARAKSGGGNTTGGACATRGTEGPGLVKEYVMRGGAGGGELRMLLSAHPLPCVLGNSSRPQCSGSLSVEVGVGDDGGGDDGAGGGGGGGGDCDCDGGGGEGVMPFFAALRTFLNSLVEDNKEGEVGGSSMSGGGVLLMPPYTLLRGCLKSTASTSMCVICSCSGTR